MATRLADTYDLYDALKAEGFQLPKETASVELLAPPGGIFQLRITTNCTPEMLQIISRALVRIADKGLHLGT